MRLPSELGPGCAPPAVCKALLPSDRVRRATEVDRGDRIEKEKALARPFPKHNEALRSFFLSLPISAGSNNPFGVASMRTRTVPLRTSGIGTCS